MHACDSAEVLGTDLSKLPLTAKQKDDVSELLGHGPTVKKHDFLARLAEGESLWILLCQRT